MFKKASGSLLLSIYFFFSNGLLNHAASLSFFFILSFVPALMFIIYTSGLLLVNSPELYEQMMLLIKEINSFVWNSLLSGNFIVNDIGSSNVGFIGGIMLLFSSTLFIRSVIRGFDQIFNTPCYKNIIVSYFVPIIINLLSVVVIVFLIFANVIIGFLIKYSGVTFLEQYGTLLDLFSYFASTPILIIFLTSLFFYKFFPGKKLSWRLLVFISFMFSINIFLFKEMFYGAVGADQFNIYGSAGVLLVSLLSFYLFFIAFLFWAQFAYVHDNIKVLTIRFFLDSSKKLWFRNIVMSTVVSLAGEYVRFYSMNDKFIFDKASEENIFFIAQGKISIGNKIFSDGIQSFFVPKDLLKDQVELEAEVLDNLIIINMPLNMYYKLLNESTRLKQEVVDSFRM